MHTKQFWCIATFVQLHKKFVGTYGKSELGIK